MSYFDATINHLRKKQVNKWTHLLM
jgi:hypothetical protein